jgi:two-component system sensor histidine kinase DesK
MPMTRTLPAWLQPAPDSETAQVIARGGSRAGPYVHLLWSVWMLVTPLFSDGYTGQWLAITALSYPVFLWLFTRAMLAPRRHMAAMRWA